MLLGEVRGLLLGPYKIVQQAAALWGGPDCGFVSRPSQEDWSCPRALRLGPAAGAADGRSEDDARGHAGLETLLISAFSDAVDKITEDQRGRIMDMAKMINPDGGNAGKAEGE